MRLLMFVLLVSATATPLPTLAEMRWHHRVLVVFASSPTDAALAEQRRIAADPGFAERDLRLVTVIGDLVEGAGDRAAALRRRFGADHGFHVALVGKDGGIKLVRSAPIGPQALWGTIDAMPMRKDEAGRRRRSALPAPSERWLTPGRRHD